MGVNAPAIALEICLTEKDTILDYVVPIAESISALIEQKNMSNSSDS